MTSRQVLLSVAHLTHKQATPLTVTPPSTALHSIFTLENQNFRDTLTGVGKFCKAPLGKIFIAFHFWPNSWRHSDFRRKQVQWMALSPTVLTARPPVQRKVQGLHCSDACETEGPSVASVTTSSTGASLPWICELQPTIREPGQIHKPHPTSPRSHPVASDTLHEPAASIPASSSAWPWPSAGHKELH